MTRLQSAMVGAWLTTIIFILFQIVFPKLWQGVMTADAAAWVQAVGSIVAIWAGFAVANRQRRDAQFAAMNEQAHLARASVELLNKVIERVGDRLSVAYHPFSKSRRGMALREFRTTEIVQTLREFNFREIPADMQVLFSSMRSNLYSINCRITQVYISEEEKGISESRRQNRLASSIRVYRSTIIEFGKLRSILLEQYGLDSPDITLDADMRVILSDTSTEEE